MKYDINLIDKKELSVVDRVIQFFSSYLRYALVLTLLIVLCVFLYRLMIDQQIADLEDSLMQKQEIVKVIKPLLTQADFIDRQLAASTEILKSQNKSQQSMNYILDTFPADLFLSHFSFTDEKIVLDGETTNVPQLQQYYKKLQSESMFSTASITSLVRKESGFEFSIELVPKS
jgi:hypothetical protein